MIELSINQQAEMLSILRKYDDYELVDALEGISYVKREVDKEISQYNTGIGLGTIKYGTGGRITYNHGLCFFIEDISTEDGTAPDMIFRLLCCICEEDGWVLDSHYSVFLGDDNKIDTPTWYAKRLEALTVMETAIKEQLNKIL